MRSAFFSYDKRRHISVLFTQISLSLRHLLFFKALSAPYRKKRSACFGRRSKSSRGVLDLMQNTSKLVDESCEAERRKRERIKSNQLCEWISLLLEVLFYFLRWRDTVRCISYIFSMECIRVELIFSSILYAWPAKYEHYIGIIDNALNCFASFESVLFLTRLRLWVMTTVKWLKML